MKHWITLEPVGSHATDPFDKQDRLSKKEKAERDKLLEQLDDILNSPDARKRAEQLNKERTTRYRSV